MSTTPPSAARAARHAHAVGSLQVSMADPEAWHRSGTTSRSGRTRWSHTEGKTTQALHSRSFERAMKESRWEPGEIPWLCVCSSAYRSDSPVTSRSPLPCLRLPRTAALIRLAHLAGAIAGRNRLRLGLKRHAVTQQRTTARRAVLATINPCRTAAVQTHV